MFCLFYKCPFAHRNPFTYQADVEVDAAVNGVEDDYDPNQEMKAGLRRLGLSALAAGEFINNGIDSLERLRLLSKEDLDRLIKQIHRDNAAAGGAGIFIPFISQA